MCHKLKLLIASFEFQNTRFTISIRYAYNSGVNREINYSKYSIYYNQYTHSVENDGLLKRKITSCKLV